MSGTSKPKSQLCREVGADLLVDDNPAYALECAQNGIEVLLFDWDHGYPWSKTAEGPVHPLITRVSSWEVVQVELAKRVARGAAARGGRGAAAAPLN